MTGDATAFVRVLKDGIDLFVRLTPRGGMDAIDGAAASSDGRVHLAARVRAAPEKGAANEALIALIADAIGVPKRAVSIAAGATSRLKTVRVAGDPEKLVEAARLLGR